MPDAECGDNLLVEETATPVFALEQTLGVGDAWALIGMANAAWDGEVGRWVTLTGEWRSGDDHDVH